MLRTLAPLALLACGDPDAPPPASEPGPEPDVTAPAPTLRRLTQAQYRNALTDLFGEGLVLPTSLEPDTPVDGLLAVGASLTALSPYGVERYEDAAYDLAAQVMADEARRSTVVGCTPSGITDRACAESALSRWGRRAWRRPVAPDELALLTDLAELAALELGDFHDGLGYALAGVLQSPHFLYRQELGTAGAFDSWEVASRLAFFLWDSIPDDTLLDAAASDALSTPAAVEEQARRMLDDPRGRRGVRGFATEWLELYALDVMSKDPTVFPHFAAGIGASAREETLAVVEDIVFAKDDPFLDLLTTRQTFLDRNLAMIYGVPAPAREGFGPVALPLEDGRIGFLGQVSFLALQSYAVSSSATQRGKFVRETLLCMTIPPPPAGLNTGIPEPSANAPTLRERVAVHLENAYCAGCHDQMDPIGLGFENFDGLGLWRSTENGAPIDPSGHLDGVPFQDAVGLAVAVRQHPEFARCVSDTVFAYANGHRPTDGERPVADWLAARFAADDHSFRELLVTLATSAAFRAAGEVE